MIKRIIFDFDGTLANTVPLCMTCFHDAWEPFVGHPLTDQEIFATFGYSEEGMIRQLMPPPWEKALAELYQMYERLHPVLCPALFDGIAELLNSLKAKGIPLDLLTGKGERCCDISLAYFHFENTFDIIIPGDPEKRHKTDALCAIMAHTNTRPEELLYIGDAPSDVKACQDAGVRCLSAAWTPDANQAELEQLNPGLVFSSVGALDAYLQHLLT